MIRNIHYRWILMCALAFIPPANAQEQSPKITRKHVAAAERIIGLEFTKAERDSLLDDLVENREDYRKIRELSLDNTVAPALQLNPIPQGLRFHREQQSLKFSPVNNVTRPENLEELAYYSVAQLGELIRTRQVSSTELTRMFLERLKRYDGQLHAVITLTEELALKQAARADEEIAVGRYRGPLHGIPWGAKDLLAVEGYPTTWGAKPYQNQVIDETATVVNKLEEAGAVLVAKLSLGALAWGDVWFGGKTRNPWNLEEGSSGSSAGPGAAVSAGLVPFAIGSETWGSIVSPSTRNGVTGHRPTFGMVSRAGAMALSWSMDKLGPMCRTVEDCAIVLNIIRGSDGLDPSAVDMPFNYRYDRDVSQMRIGYIEAAFERDRPGKANDAAVLEVLESLGVELVPIELPDFPIRSLSFILSAEAAAAFDDLTLTNEDDQLVRQIKNAWPNVFRASRFIPAVEYIQANRARQVVIGKLNEIIAELDAYVAPSFSDNLLLTNLTGHPCTVVPNGFNDKGSPTSISFMGHLYDDGTVMTLARAYQEATEWHRKHPPMFP